MSLTARLRRLGAARRTTVAAALALTLAGSLAACGGDDAEASDGFGSINVQYSWIKNEEFTGEFYAYENGYYDEAGFDEVNGISGPDTGVAKLLSGEVQVALSDAASIGAAIAEQDAPSRSSARPSRRTPSPSCPSPTAPTSPRPTTSSASGSACRTPTPASSARC